MSLLKLFRLIVIYTLSFSNIFLMQNLENQIDPELKELLKNLELLKNRINLEKKTNSFQQIKIMIQKITDPVATVKSEIFEKEVEEIYEQILNEETKKDLSPFISEIFFIKDIIMNFSRKPLHIIFSPEDIMEKIIKSMKSLLEKLYADNKLSKTRQQIGFPMKKIIQNFIETTNHILNNKNHFQKPIEKHLQPKKFQIIQHEQNFNT